MKRGLLFSVFVLSFLFSIYSVSASIGVSPGYYIIDFKPGLKTNLYFDFTEDRPLPLEIYVEGDLAEYVKLSTKKLSGSGSVGVQLELPDKIDIPGTHVIYVGARQVSGGSEGLGIVGSIKGSIKVVVPYPGQYATISISSNNANVGEPVNFTTLVDNLGSESVSATGSISIFNNKSYITDISLGEMDLSSPERITFVNHLNTNTYPPGNYLALAQLFYGNGNTAQGNTSFRLGELNVRIINYTTVVQKDKINKFDINIQSDWNDDIRGVYANVTLNGYPTSFLTPTTNLEGFGSSTLSGFFDTSGIQNSTFDAVVKLYFEDKVNEQTITIGFEKKADYVIIALVLAILLIVVAVVYITYRIKKAEKNKRGR